MEIGSFIELQFPKGLEYYSGEKNTARLNTGRAAIWHAFRTLKCDAVWLPRYQCDTVRDFLRRKNVPVKYYRIDDRFEPIDLTPRENEAVLLVNYYGVMSQERMSRLAAPYKNVIIDNSQGFFSTPIARCMNVYSCRKFVGVPDGAYVIGDHAEDLVREYPRGYSSDTSLFLLQRIEYGCEGKAYASRGENEHRIDVEDAMQMSKLTRTILDGTDYEFIRRRRRSNFACAAELFAPLNKIDPLRYCHDDCVPMVYPLVIEDDSLLARLQAAKHFQGHWWSYLCSEMPEDSFEHWLSRYVIPITIDQRYGPADIERIFRIVTA